MTKTIIKATCYCVLFLALLVLSGCGLLNSGELRATNLRAGTGIDSSYNVTGTSEVFSQVKTIHLSADFICTGWLQGGTYLDVLLDGESYVKFKQVSQYTGPQNGYSNDLRKLYSEITTTDASLPVGQYSIKISEWSTDASVFPGGELTFEVQ
jgi:hypothetical protein